MKKIEKQTTKLFTGIHNSQLQNKSIFNRLVNLYSESFFKVKKNFFKKKICLDAGSGLNLNATLALIKLGAEYVYAIDLNKKIKKIKKPPFNKFHDKYEVRHGNLKKLPYPSNFFDFVLCAGAIHHTTDWKKSLNELSRVTKKTGYIYIEAYGKGGLVRDLTTALRIKFKTSSNFRKLILNLSTFQVRDFCRYFFERKNIKNINNLIDDDLILTIKDRIMSPIYQEFSQDEIVVILKKNKFKNIKKLRRFPKFKNVRKYLSKFYYDHDHKYSKILYGSGMPHILAKKS